MNRTYGLHSGFWITSKLLTILVLCFCLGSTGCTGLDDVSAFSAVAGELRETLPRVTNDVPVSCARRNQLRADVPNAEGTKSSLDCAPYVALAKQLGADQAILIQYLETLSQLAVKQTPSYPAAIHQATAQIAGLPGMSAHAAAATTAAGGLGAAIADAATKHYRERTSGKLMVTTDPSVQELCTALERVVGTDYTSLLDDEELETTSFYNDPLAERKTEERLTLILVQRQRDEDLAVLKRHRAAALAYVAALQQTAKLHAQMATFAREHASSRSQAARDLAPTLIALKGAISDLETTLH